MSGMGDIPDQPPGATKPCPHCGGTMLPDVYGYPDQDLFDAEDRGEVYLHGCVIPQGPIPEWRCPDCRHESTVPGPSAEA